MWGRDTEFGHFNGVPSSPNKLILCLDQVARQHGIRNAFELSFLQDGGSPKLTSPQTHSFTQTHTVKPVQHDWSYTMNLPVDLSPKGGLHFGEKDVCLFFLFFKRSVDSNSSPTLNKCDRLSYLSNLQMVIFNFANNSAGFVTKNLYQSCTLNNLHLCILFISLGAFFCLHEPLQYKEY